ncbi:MAG: hypothetical protein Rubg2KO_08690 [Rubricoccaceae bacterium]
MSRTALSNTGDWKLKFEDTQDVRGYRALDADGTSVGTVDAMIVNTDRKLVDAIVLEDGTEYPARDVSIGDQVVYLTTLNGASGVNGEVRVYDDGEVIRRVEVDDTDVDAHTDAFRSHYTTTYGDTGYDDYDSAYRYGYETAYDDRYKNRAYVDAEDDLRTDYTSRYSDREFDTDRSAIRYGYTRAQHGAR